MIPIIATPAAETAPATPTLLPAPSPTLPVGATGTPAFDAILMLQNLAATAETLDAANFEAADTAELIGTHDSTDDEDDSDELEASLAFLAGLLTATVSKNPTRQFDTGGEPQREAREKPEEPMPVPVNARNATLDFTATAMNMLLNDITEETDNALFTSLPPEPVERSGQGTEVTQNLVRAAEMLSSARTGAAPAVERPTIATPVRDPRWADELGAKVVLMVRGGESTASLQLTPVDLGPVEVNVTVKETQATVHFGASQAETRALLEASLPRLRELLEAQGYQLTDASVSSGFSRSQRQDTPTGGAGAADVEPVTTEVRSVRDLGILDVYA